MTSKTLFDQDFDRKTRPVDLISFMRYARDKHRKSPMDIVREWVRLSRGDGRVPLGDYFTFRLYDDDHLTWSDKLRFISDDLHWPIANRCCDPTWKAATEDKWLCYNILTHLGLPTPRTLAVIDGTNRLFGADPIVRTPAELKALVRGHGGDIFAKPNLGIGSFGAVLITGVDGDRLTIEQGEPIGCDEFFEKIVGARTYLLQDRLRNHASLAPLTNYLATVRTINLVRPDSIHTPVALIKIPGPRSIADNYWRKGNLIADIDLETGTVRRAIRGKGIETEILTTVPDSGAPLVGFVLPDWPALRQLNETVARHFSPVRYQSLDIALTDRGPVVVEVNTGAAFDLPQLASGKGFLTEEVKDFFEECGWVFKSRRKARAAVISRRESAGRRGSPAAT